MSKVIDLIGQKFGYWNVLERDLSKKGTAYWICQCQCGTIRSVCGSSLRNGASTSCGCYRTENSRTNNGTYINELGNRYGKLVVIAKDEELSKEKHRAQWICKCDCGNIITTSSKCLREGKTTSCGCRTRSIGEDNISQVLIEQQINFIEQYGVSINGSYYRYDFALIDNNKNPIRLIEFDGIQHFDNINLHWSQDITATQRRDRIKNKYAFSHNIPLIRIPYWERDKITIDLILGDKYLVKQEVTE